MAHLAIKGHATRGNEVIALLEMLGGKNIYKLDGKKDLWYILSNSVIEYATYCFQEQGYMLDEFEARFPYKVGDEVISQYGKLGRISSLIWSDRDNQVRYELESDVDSLYFANELQALKDDDMQADVGTVNINLADYYKGYNEVEVMISDGWKFEQRGDKMFAIRKQYPKTYQECCKIVNASIFVSLVYNITNGEGYSHDVDNLQIYDNIRRLKICRDAYWKIAGDWNPDWNNIQDKHCIYVVSGEFWLKECQTRQCTLAFPTAEMRDTFYENFKDLIKQCKELL